MGMKQLSNIVILVACVCSQMMAQETDLKKVYTDVTTQINSALLTRKGAFELSGFLFYDRLENKGTYENVDQKVTFETFQVETGSAYFFMNNLAAGVLFSYLNESQGVVNYEQFMGGPVIKKYFGEKQWRPYLFTNYLFMSGDILDGGEWEMVAGVLYHVTGNFGLTLQIKYGILFAKKDFTEGQNRLFVGIGLVNFIL
jgi:hypothetical protein